MNYNEKLITWATHDIKVGSLKPGEAIYDRNTQISAVSGYSTVAIAGFYLNGSNYTSCTITTLNINGNSIYWSIENRGGSQTGELTLHVNILYMKSINTP